MCLRGVLHAPHIPNNVLLLAHSLSCNYIGLGPEGGEAIGKGLEVNASLTLVSAPPELQTVSLSDFLAFSDRR